MVEGSAGPSSAGQSSPGKSPSPRASRQKSADVADVMPVIDTTVVTPETAVEDATPGSHRTDRRGARSTPEHRRPEPRSHEPRNDEPRSHEPRSHEPRSHDDRRSTSRGGERVVGMGDHVPDFILRSFRVAASVAEVAEDEQPESQG